MFALLLERLPKRTKNCANHSHKYLNLLRSFLSEGFKTTPLRGPPFPEGWPPGFLERPKSTTLRPVSPRILVVGVGGIGGVVATSLVRGGLDVSIATPNEAVQAAWRSGSGPWYNGRPTGKPLANHRILTDPRETPEPFDFAIIAVQPPVIPTVSRALVEVLRPTGQVVTLSNGLCDEVVASVLGPERTLGGVVLWGARMPEPGRYIRTSSGGFRIGGLPSAKVQPHPDLVAALSLIGPVELTSNLLGARYAKLAFNCVISTLGTIGGATLGELMVKASTRRVALAIVREAVEVSRKAGVELERVNALDLDWLARAPGTGRTRHALSRTTRHTALLAVGLRYRKLRSSMLAALERGRTPAVDFLNGEIVRRGEMLQVDVTANRAAQHYVWAIAEGQKQAGLNLIDELAAEIARVRPPAQNEFADPERVW